MTRAGRATGTLGLLAALAVGAPAGAPAQERPGALSKSELVRLLVAGTYEPAEIAAIVRRNCLTFRPSAGDRADLRALGATEEVIQAADECARLAEPVFLAAEPRRLAAAAGDTVSVRASATRSGGPAEGVRIVVRRAGGGVLAAGVTDGAGAAAIRVPAGTTPGEQTLELEAPAPGARNRPRIALTVRAGRPAEAELEPARLVVAADADGPRRVRVAVRDAYGNPVAGAVVEAARPGGAAAAQPASTDAGGEATLVVDPGRAARAARLEGASRAELAILVAGERLATLPLEVAAPRVAQGEEADPPALAAAPDGGARAGRDGNAPGARGEGGAAGDSLPPAPAAPTSRRAGGDADPSADSAAGAGGVAAALVDAVVWGGGRFEAGRSAGNGALEVVVHPLRTLRLRGVFDEGVDAYAPLLVRGGDSFRTLLAGAELDWGEGGRFTTLIEGGRRDQAEELFQNLYRLEQSVRFRTGDGDGRWRAGAFFGRWFDRDDWVAYTAVEVPVAAGAGVLGGISSGETVGTNVGETGRRADRDTRLSVGAWAEPGGGVRIEPVVTVGRVESDEAQFDGTLVEGRLRVAVRVGSGARFQLFLRHQRPPGDPPFTSVAAGLSFRVDRRP